jgi:hypothetical protein
MTSAETSRPLVLVSWDGTSPPLGLLHVDVRPEFEVVLFDYSGQPRERELLVHGTTCTVLSAKTECKGEIYSALARHLSTRDTWPEYVGLIDDDVIVSVGDLNYALHVARCAQLDSFSPSLSHDSEFTHRWTLRQPNRLFHRVDWVEVMMPFYRGQLFAAGSPHYGGSISSWGIDKYLMPTLQKLLGLDRVAVIDAVMASHRRPVTSGAKVYRNGLTAAEESARLKALCLAMLEQQRPELRRTEWFERIFVRRHARTLTQRLWFGIGRPLRRWLEQST